MHGVCGNGTCQNIPGSFVCSCKEGFENSEMMQVCIGKLLKLVLSQYCYLLLFYLKLFFYI